MLHNILALLLILEDTLLAFHCGVWYYLSAYKMCLDCVVKYSLSAFFFFFLWQGWRGDAGQLVGSQFPKPRPQQWKPGVLPTRLPWNSLSVPILKREFTMSGRGILSNVVAVSVEMTMWNPHHLTIQKESPFPFPSFLPLFLPSILPQIHRNLHL